MKDYAGNMRRRNGTDHKQSVIKTERSVNQDDDLSFQTWKDNYAEFTDLSNIIPFFRKRVKEAPNGCASRKWLIKNVNEDNFPVCLYFKILEKRPQSATTDRFFLTENPNWENAYWYKNCPIGINKLSSWTKESAKKISLDIVITQTSRLKIWPWNSLKGPRKIQKFKVWPWLWSSN